MSTMIGVKVFEAKDSGLVELIEMPTEKPLDDVKDQLTVIEALVKMAYEHDSMFLVYEGRGVVICDLSHKTIVVRGVFEKVDPLS